MNRLRLFLLMGLFLPASCKKTTTQLPPASGTGKFSPNLIGLAFQPGLPIDIHVFHIYDLDHDDNKDKKYFRIALYSTDSARIVMEPKPIDSLSMYWPAAIKKVRWSPGAEFIIDNQSYIRMSGGSFIQTPYNQISPQHAWLSQYKNTINPFFLPNGEANMYGQLRLFYLNIAEAHISVFDHQDSTGAAWYGTNSLKNVLGPAFGLYDWYNVTQMIWLPNSNTFYFFDFTNWRYWTIDKSNGIAHDWVGHPVKGLDRFLKWPEGWGKK